VSLADALAELYARVPLGMRLGLDAMRAACEAEGHPERAFETVHVAGTNGKGSVCALVESAARASGTKTGLYPSPHLVKLAERIRIDGAPIEDDALERVLGRALRIGPDLSFFETVTLAAYLAFRDAGVGLGVIEVGIGGRLDATNVVERPRVTAVTRIALDHMDKLGHTLPEIAREKAAIAKPGVPMIVGNVARDVRDAIQQVVLAAGARAVDAPVEGADLERARAACALLGDHQRDNVAVAFAITRELGIPESAVLEGFRATRWPGRLERIDTEDGPYLLDGAHNPDGAHALARYVRSLPLPDGAPAAVVFGALADKAWAEMLDILAPIAARRVYVEPQGRVAAPAVELARRHAGDVARSLPEGLARARTLAGPRGLVVVCGSLYLVGEARALLLDLERDPSVGL
jgi:dihydrofolate synthase/folylpolyglutamate synthase